MSDKSSYFLKLKEQGEEVAQRYEMKLSVINHLDSFVLRHSEISFNPSDFPAITSIDIVTYLVLTTSYSQEMKAFKSLNAFKYFEAGFVSGCGVLKIKDLRVLVGKVKHSQKMNLQPLEVWIICQQDGSVISAHCTYMAGLGEVCSRIGALLYAAEYIITSKANSSCTDSRATWKVPTTSKVEYIEPREISFSTIFNYKSKSDTLVVPQDELCNALQELKDIGTSSVLMTLTEHFSLEFAQKQAVSDLVIPNPYTNLHQEEFELYNLEQLINLCLSFA